MDRLLIFSAIDFGQLLPFAIFGLFAVGAWGLLQLLNKEDSLAERRLDELSDPRKRKREDREGTKSDAVTRMLEKASPALARPLQPKDEKTAGALKLKLSHAGFRSELAPTVFMALRMVGGVTGFIVGGGVAVYRNGFSLDAGLYTALFTAGMAYLPDIVVALIAMKRKESIFLALPDALDLLVVCVESGLGLDQAMRKVAEEMKGTYREVADEFSLSNFHIQMGKPRAEVLHELGQRNGVDDLRQLAGIIIQAEKFGSSIANALRVQSDAMRTRRRQLAEERAAKTAVKLIFPLVLFIFPAIFVVLVGPAAITMVNEMFPAMNGR